MKTDKICVIVGASGEPVSKDQIVTGGKHLVIAADGGQLKLRELGIMPDVLIGDFDSFEETPVLSAGKILKYPIEKDDTDTMLAVRYGLENGYRNFLLLSCIGGKRLDHSIATVQTLGFIAENGGIGIACDGRKDICGEEQLLLAVKNSRIVFPEKMKGDLSAFSLTGRCSGVDILNLKYRACNTELTSLFPLGVSNSFVGKSAEISVSEGVLLLYFKRCGMPFEDVFGFVEDK